MQSKKRKISPFLLAAVLLVGIGFLAFLQQRSSPGAQVSPQSPRIKEVAATQQADIVKPSRDQFFITKVAREERYLLVQSTESRESLQVLLEKTPRIIQWYFPFENGNAPPGTVAAGERFVDESAFQVGQKILLYSVPHEESEATVWATQIYIFP